MGGRSRIPYFPMKLRPLMGVYHDTSLVGVDPQGC